MKKNQYNYQYLILTILGVCVIYSLYLYIYNNDNRLKNIYGEPLVPCRRVNNKNDQRGSWNKNGYCDETSGGVHQICVNVD